MKRLPSEEPGRPDGGADRHRLARSRSSPVSPSCSRERQQFNRAQIDTPAITRFTSAAADFGQAAPDFRALVLGDASRRGAHYELGRADVGRPTSTAAAIPRTGCASRCQSAGIRVRESERAIDPSPPERRRDGRAPPTAQTMLLSVQLADGEWLNARLNVPGQPPLAHARAGAGHVAPLSVRAVRRRADRHAARAPAARSHPRRRGLSRPQRAGRRRACRAHPTCAMRSSRSTR